MVRSLARAARLGAAALAVAACAAAASDWPIRPYYDFVHFFSIGRFDRTLASFADDAIVTAGEACRDDDPCVGKKAIAARYLPALRAGDLPLPLVDLRFDGRWLHTRGDRAWRAAPGGDIVARHGSHRIELRDERIRRLEFRWSEE